jgi:hypothetical protein
MSKSVPAIQSLARRLIAGEPTRAKSAHGEADQTVQACEKLRVPLSNLAGAAGYASLLSRALVLAKRQAPWLGRLHVEVDGALAQSNGQVPRELGAAETAQHGGAILVAELLGLLVTLIGESLTLRLVREAFPNESIETLTLRTEEKS